MSSLSFISATLVSFESSAASPTRNDSSVWGINFNFRVADTTLSFTEGLIFNQVSEERADGFAGGTP
ncbi:MAG: hypothetical protein Q9182_005027 [Xanthomendoza sp. 2 TL-2023]